MGIYFLPHAVCRVTWLGWRSQLRKCDRKFTSADVWGRHATSRCIVVMREREVNDWLQQLTLLIANGNRPNWFFPLLCYSPCGLRCRLRQSTVLDAKYVWQPTVGQSRVILTQYTAWSCRETFLSVSVKAVACDRVSGKRNQESSKCIQPWTD